MKKFTKEALLLTCTCLFMFLFLSGCKSDDDNEDKILEQRDGYKKFINHEMKGIKGTIKDAKGWIGNYNIANSSTSIWVISFADSDRGQLPVSASAKQVYTLSGNQEEIQQYANQNVTISGRYKYLYTTWHLEFDAWLYNDFFEIDYIDITPYED